MIGNRFSVHYRCQRCQVGLSAVSLVVVDHFAQSQPHEELVVLFGYFREQIVPMSVSDYMETFVGIDFPERVIAEQFVFVSELARIVRFVGFDRLKEPCPVGIKYHLESELNPALELTLVLSVWFLRDRKCHGAFLSLRCVSHPRTTYAGGRERLARYYCSF